MITMRSVEKLDKRMPAEPTGGSFPYSSRDFIQRLRGEVEFSSPKTSRNDKRKHDFHTMKTKYQRERWRQGAQAQ